MFNDNTGIFTNPANHNHSNVDKGEKVAIIVHLCLTVAHLIGVTKAVWFSSGYMQTKLVLRLYTTTSGAVGLSWIVNQAF